ncbi:MAG: 4'-phosphopantetheinyl transferase superfamily protein [Marinilabiliaceae bacterium]|nr:4'-phosphopantetheinyl transferase superfamily protein [Marinilabiliaceae bacterium]
MPIERIIDSSDQHKVAVWRVTESLDELLQLISLSSQDNKKINSFRLEKRKREWLACRILLHHLIGKYPQIEYNKSGKPFLADQSYHISLSHTDGYVAASVSVQPTALDIELCSPRINKVAQRYMHDREWAFVEDEQSLSYLTLIWSAKETLFKYFDESMVVFKDHFRIAPFQLNSEGHFQASCFYYNETVNLRLDYLHLPQFVLVYHLYNTAVS